MEFTAEQERALQSVADWLEGDSQVFKLFGYAGTGKTTLAQYVGASHYAAFTGKAAYVMRSKGCASATTIHSLIYHPRDKSRERLRDLEDELRSDPSNTELVARIEEERKELARPVWVKNLDSVLKGAKLLAIDECSMVDERMALDLMSYGCKILVLGDPAQLPPIGAGGYFNDNPDFLLEEIHRQARDNPILDLATTIRETGVLPESHPCLHTGTLTPRMALGVDQLIVGRNKTRHACNRRIREELGRESVLPVIGDKVVCTKNNHELGIMNGAVYKVTDTPYDEVMELEGGLLVDYHPELFTGEHLDWWREGDAEKFEYGFALTCHKAQGSQWDKVGIIDQSRQFRPHSARWLYTAVTRAAKELWIVTE